MRQAKSIGSIFADILSSSNNDINAIGGIIEIIASNDCAELFDILVINSLGYKCPINESTIDNAVKHIIERKCIEIDRSQYTQADKEYEKKQWSDFYIIAGSGIKQRFETSGLLRRL